MSQQDHTFTRRRALGLGVGALAAGALVATGCSDMNQGASVDRSETGATTRGDFGGDLFEPPLEKPDTVFTDLDGNPFDLREQSADQLSMLFFGYTNCPNECPIYLQTLASARVSIRSGPGSRPQVLFVGVDTERDTPEVMREYLANIDSTFIGLTASPEVIDDALGQLMLPGVAIGEPDENGNYEVGHTARSIVFTPDNLAHRMYGYDTRQTQWVRDLPLLAQGEWQ